jgi:hypothetical protein
MEEEKTYKKFRVILYLIYFGSIAVIGIYLFILLQQTRFKELSVDTILSSPVLILFFIVNIINSYPKSCIHLYALPGFNSHRRYFGLYRGDIE